MNKMQKVIKKEFSKVGLVATFGDDYINIARKDGVHCEFYGQLDTQSYLNATYTIENKVQDLDFSFCEYDLDQFYDFLSTVQIILEVGPKGGVKRAKVS